MRLWTLHPRYLDPQGLVALWREGLLARKVLAGQTRGYRHHPQLTRFRATPDPLAAIDAYLHAVADEADARGYHFRRDKLGPRSAEPQLDATEGQLAFERGHLRAKLTRRDPARLEALPAAGAPEAHPLFALRAGPIEDWERP